MKMTRRGFLGLAAGTALALSCPAHATILAETPTGWTTDASYGGTDVCLYNDTTVTATSAGTAQNTIIYLPADAWDFGASALKIRWYRQSDNSFAGETVYADSDGTGAVTKALGATFAVGSSEQFYPLMVANGSIHMSTNGASFETLNPTGTYASPPSTIAPGSDPGGTRGKFRVALDGTTSGGSNAPRAEHYKRLMGFLDVKPANDDVFLLRASR